MGLSFLKYLLFAGSLLFSLTAATQPVFRQIDSSLTVLNPDIKLKAYGYIFIGRFNLCYFSERKKVYCGERLADYVIRKTGKRGLHLVVTSDTSSPFIRKVARQKNINIIYVPTQDLEKFGLFSFYPLEINRRRQVRKLN